MQLTAAKGDVITLIFSSFFFFELYNMMRVVSTNKCVVSFLFSWLKMGFFFHVCLEDLIQPYPESSAFEKHVVSLLKYINIQKWTCLIVQYIQFEMELQLICNPLYLYLYSTNMPSQIATNITNTQTSFSENSLNGICSSFSLFIIGKYNTNPIWSLLSQAYPNNLCWKCIKNVSSLILVRYLKTPDINRVIRVVYLSHIGNVWPFPKTGNNNTLGMKDSLCKLFIVGSCLYIESKRD